MKLNLCCAWSGAFPSGVAEQPQVGVPSLQRYRQVINALGWPRVRDRGQQLSENDDLVVVDRLCNSTPRLKPVVTGAVGEAGVHVRVSGNQWTKEGPKLPGDLSSSRVSRRHAVKHREAAEACFGVDFLLLLLDPVEDLVHLRATTGKVVAQSLEPELGLLRLVESLPVEKVLLVVERPGPRSA